MIKELILPKDIGASEAFPKTIKINGHKYTYDGYCQTKDEVKRTQHYFRMVKPHLSVRTVKMVHGRKGKKKYYLYGIYKSDKTKWRR